MTILYLLSKQSGVFARGKESNLSSAQEIQTMLSLRNTNYVGFLQRKCHLDLDYFFLC